MYNPKSANIFMLLFLIYSIFIPIALAFVPKEYFEYIMVLQDIFLILIPVAVYFLLTKRKVTDVIPLNKLSLKNIGYVILITLLSWPLFVLVSSISSMFATTAINDSITEYIEGYSMLTCVVAFAAMPAVFEEVLCRGVIMSNYKTTSPVIMYVISALFFGFIHMNFQQMSYAIVAGIILAFMVHQTNSIFASVLSHFVINGTQVVVAKLAQASGIIDSEAATNAELGWDIILYYCVVAAIFGIILWKVIKKFKAYNVDNAAKYMNNEAGTNKKFVDGYFISSVVLFLLIIVCMEFAYRFNGL